LESIQVESETSDEGGSENNIEVEFETSEWDSKYNTEESETIANIAGTSFIHLVHSSLLYLFCSGFLFIFV